MIEKHIKTLPTADIYADQFRYLQGLLKWYKEKCLENDMDDYVTKPLTKKALLDMVRKWVSPEGAENSPPGVDVGA